MSAYDELAELRDAGPQVLRLLLDLTRAVVRRRNYPDPAGRGFWADDEIAELANETVLQCSRAGGFAAHLLEHATDEETLRRVLARRIRNADADLSRKTDVGHLSTRLHKLLRGDDAFVEVAGMPDTWTLAEPTPSAEPGRSELVEAPAGSEAVGFEDLLRAAHAVPGVRLVRWRPELERRSPFAEHDSLVRLATAVLAAAPRPLQHATLTSVLADYFGLVPGLVSMATTPGELIEGQAIHPVTGSPDEAGADALAQLVWDQLSDTERVMVSYLEESLQTAADQLGWRKTYTHTVRSRTRTVIAIALGLQDDPDGRMEPEVSLDLHIGEAAQVFEHLLLLAERHRPSGSPADHRHGDDDADTGQGGGSIP